MLCFIINVIYVTSLLIFYFFLHVTIIFLRKSWHITAIVQLNFIRIDRMDLTICVTTAAPNQQELLNYHEPVFLKTLLWSMTARASTYEHKDRMKLLLWRVPSFWWWMESLKTVTLKKIIKQKLCEWREIKKNLQQLCLLKYELSVWLCYISLSVLLQRWKQESDNTEKQQ